MKGRYILIIIISGLVSTSAFAQEKIDRQIRKSMEKSNVTLDRFSRKSERRTKKAERRFDRYEKKIIKRNGIDKIESDRLLEPRRARRRQTSNQKLETNLGKEPLLDSLRLINGFAAHADIPNNQESPITSELDSRAQSAIANQKSSIKNKKSAIKNKKSINRAQMQLNATQRTKSELLARKEYWKSQIGEVNQKSKIEIRQLRRMEKERYYYTAQINEYRKPLRDPSNLDEKLMTALRNDPRFADFMATLPAKPQNPAKMQPRQLVQQMIKSQAEAIDADPATLISDAKRRGPELLGSLTKFGNVDNAAQIPKFTPNPYKTKSFWQRIDIGFNLQFDNRNPFMPSTVVAGAQAAFKFDPKFSMGVLANYRFGLGDITNIQFSHAGAGYGGFANYKIWKNVGAQVGFERNWRVGNGGIGEIRYPATWTSSVLMGLTYEYGIGKKMRGTMGVFFDCRYKQHTPKTNAVLWRMGWKM
jgi:hypothetical protein